MTCKQYRWFAARCRLGTRESIYDSGIAVAGTRATRWLVRKQGKQNQLALLGRSVIRPRNHHHHHRRRHHQKVKKLQKLNQPTPPLLHHRLRRMKKQRKPITQRIKAKKNRIRNVMEIKRTVRKRAATKVMKLFSLCSTHTYMN